jgi:hypothetical protein
MIEVSAAESQLARRRAISYTTNVAVLLFINSPSAILYLLANTISIYQLAYGAQSFHQIFTTGSFR